MSHTVSPGQGIAQEAYQLGSSQEAETKRGCYK